MRISDWSSDVCSSDLTCGTRPPSNLSGLTLNKDSTATKKVGTNTTARGVAANMPPNTAKPTAFWLAELDRKSVVSGKSVSVRVDIGGRRIIKQKNILYHQIINTLE